MMMSIARMPRHVKPGRRALSLPRPRCWVRRTRDGCLYTCALVSVVLLYTWTQCVMSYATMSSASSALSHPAAQVPASDSAPSPRQLALHGLFSPRLEPGRDDEGGVDIMRRDVSRKGTAKGREISNISLSVPAARYVWSADKRSRCHLIAVRRAGIIRLWAPILSGGAVCRSRLVRRSKCRGQLTTACQSCSI